MDQILYMLFTFAYIALLIWGFKGINAQEVSKWTSVVYLVVIALIYDNGILAIGHWIGEGALLEKLNTVRFWAHAIVTPLLVLYSIGTLRESGVSWARKTWVTILSILYTIAAIILEIIFVTADLRLQVENEYGVVSYGSVDPPSGPPIMILFVTIAMLIAGGVLWKKTGWAVFFIGVVIMTIGSAVPLDVGSNVITNLFELILLTSLVWTKRKLIPGELHVK
ncbi:phospholipid phosphatase [Saccharococcus sp. Marseille-Q5394]|uniref:phospholipid phosphatase n=1 Tax=Saccharococcus sp. Marseille-Q5394 TaxID=2972778 RepID=UPI0021C8239A|nr:phospholipid phosphatase [Saccharococcus sp. Marseille-Q5394]